jgi:hypothetical protein
MQVRARCSIKKRLDIEANARALYLPRYTAEWFKKP